MNYSTLWFTLTRTFSDIVFHWCLIDTHFGCGLVLRRLRSDISSFFHCQITDIFKNNFIYYQYVSKFLNIKQIKVLHLKNLDLI